MDSPRDHFGSKGWLGVADMTTPAVGDKMLVRSIQPVIKISSTKVPKVFSQKDP